MLEQKEGGELIGHASELAKELSGVSLESRSKMPETKVKMRELLGLVVEIKGMKPGDTTEKKIGEDQTVKFRASNETDPRVAHLWDSGHFNFLQLFQKNKETGNDQVTAFAFIDTDGGSMLYEKDKEEKFVRPDVQYTKDIENLGETNLSADRRSLLSIHANRYREIRTVARMIRLLL